MLLFGTLAIWAGFNAVPGWQSSLILAVALLLSIFSMSPLLADVIWGIWIFRECLLHYRQGGTIRREWLIRCTAVSVLVAAGNLLFFAGYTPADCGAVPAAGKLIFYACSSFVRGIALLQPELPGWGIALQVVLFLVPGLGGLYVLCRKRVAFLLENGKCAVWLGWCMVFCAAIAGARGGAVDYRHLEALLPLTPAVASLLLMIPEERMRRIVLLEYLAAVLICLSFFVKSSRPELLAEERRAGAAAVRQFTGEAGTSLDIPALYPQDLAMHWQMARERNITLFR
ncbi:MAG: hypothetical protein IKD46_06460 [Lentisphaeria bacterium]|nr:hypothetical protein [Lentisphaeria bacterium]